MTEPKVTKCFAAKHDDGTPDHSETYYHMVPGHLPAILIFEDEFDAMRKELEELRAKVIDALEDGYMAGRERQRSLHEVKVEFKKNGKVEWFKCNQEAHDDEEAK